MLTKKPKLDSNNSNGLILGSVTPSPSQFSALCVEPVSQIGHFGLRYLGGKILCPKERVLTPFEFAGGDCT